MVVNSDSVVTYFPVDFKANAWFKSCFFCEVTNANKRSRKTIISSGSPIILRLRIHLEMNKNVKAKELYGK